MSDRIFLRDAPFPCRIGVTAEERSAPQEVRVDLELTVPTVRAGESDAIADTVDYVDVWKCIDGVVTRREHHLVEALAARIAQALLDGFPSADEVLVRVTKPGALAAVGVVDVGVEVRRGRGNG